MSSESQNSSSVVAKPIAVVVPCFNEEDALASLATALAELRTLLAPLYAATFVFVDDGSTDRTPQLLHQIFGSLPDCQILRLEQNQGIAAALMAGIRHAQAELVCTIDSDCTYDPREIPQMLPLLSPEVQVVTASPYHARGRVLDVPHWRLRLSKTASAMYRIVLHQKLATYTSCFRVYRRSSVVGLELSDKRFAGVAEILGRLDLQGAVITEYPTTLRVRCAGSSKMKLFRTIFAQLSVLARLAYIRWFEPARLPLQEASLNLDPRNAEPRSLHTELPLTNSDANFISIRQGQNHATDN